MSEKVSLHRSLVITASFVVVAFLVAGLYFYTKLNEEKNDLNNKLSLTRADLTEALETNLRLSEELNIAKGDINEYSFQLESTLEKFKKLAETDDELLKQYSKVYFLNENYLPRGLTEISPLFLSNPTKSQQILVLVYPFLQRLLEEARAFGMDLKILSAYRSFGEQTVIKDSYTVTYGADTANSFSADQGYSEHQLGTTVDFTTSKLGSNISNFDETKEYKWLLEKAWEHGFVLTYPEDNPSYIYEPWHWRFVGVALAKRLFEEKQEFYTLKQRQIDAYLLDLFESEVE